MENETRSATVQVTSDIAKTLALRHDYFNLLLGPLQDITLYPSLVGKVQFGNMAQPDGKA